MDFDGFKCKGEEAFLTSLKLRSFHVFSNIAQVSLTQFAAIVSCCSDLFLTKAFSQTMYFKFIDIEKIIFRARFFKWFGLVAINRDRKTHAIRMKFCDHGNGFLSLVQVCPMYAVCIWGLCMQVDSIYILSSYSGR